MTLEEMRQIDIKEIDPENIPDLQDIKLSKTDENERKIEELLQQMDNLYVHRHGKYVVINEYCGKQSINDAFRILVESC